MHVLRFYCHAATIKMTNIFSIFSPDCFSTQKQCVSKHVSSCINKRTFSFFIKLALQSARFHTATNDERKKTKLCQLSLKIQCSRHRFK